MSHTWHYKSVFSYIAYEWYNLLETQGISETIHADGTIRQSHIGSSDLVVYVMIYISLLSEEQPLASMPESTMSVPSEAVPAIIGCEGSKVKDTSTVFNTTIKVDKTDSPLSFLSITADNEEAIEKTKNILVMAVKHYFASVEELPANSDIPTEPDEADALQDLKTFSFETFTRK